MKSPPRNLHLDSISKSEKKLNSDFLETSLKKIAPWPTIRANLAMLREINRANRAGQHRGSRYRIYSFHEYLPKFDPRKKVRNGFPPKQREGSFSASIIKISTSNSEILRVFWPSWRRDSKIERHPFSGSFHVDLGTCYIVQVHVVDISCHKCGHHHRHKRNQHHCLGKAGFKYNFFTFCFMAD